MPSKAWRNSTTPLTSTTDRDGQRRGKPRTAPQQGTLSRPRPPDHAFLHRLRGGKRIHHLHLVSAGSPLPDRYLLFRDYLRAHPDAAARYEAVKRDLAARYPIDRDRYVDEKPAVVVELLTEARRWVADTGSASTPAG